jgi:ketosteroid isomerase-like protein
VLLAPSELQSIEAAVRAADAERVAATLAADPARLGAILSDQLHYTHSNGKTDTKKSYIESLVRRSAVYTGYEYRQRDFLVASADIVLMTGRVLILAGDATAQNPHDLNILAVWRKEAGKWRFLAWQSSKVPPPAAPAAR